MKLVVLKFGGTSVADVPQIKKIALKIKKEVNKSNRVIVVVSAMAGVTNNLVDLVKTTSEIPSYSEYDVVLSTGEQVTSALLATALNNLNIKNIQLHAPDKIEFTFSNLSEITDILNLLNSKKIEIINFEIKELDLEKIFLSYLNS